MVGWYRFGNLALVERVEGVEGYGCCGNNGFMGINSVPAVGSQV